MTAPGWYANPGGRGLRYWDGTAWTEHVTYAYDPPEPAGTSSGLAAVVGGFVVSQIVAGIVGVAAVMAAIAVTGREMTVLSEEMMRDPSLLTVLTVASSIGMWTVFTTVSRFVSRRHRTGSFRTDLGLVGFRWTDVPIALGVAAVVRIYTIAVAIIADVLFGPFEGDGQLPVDLAEQTGWIFVVFTLLVTVGAPVFEELYFRGLLQRSLLSRFRPAVALTATAAAFALVHITPGDLGYSVLTVVSIFPAGLALGALAHWRGNLFASILTHLIFNASAVALLAAGV